MENYAEDYAILLPGRIPGVRDYGKAKLLPSSVSRRMVYKQYADAGRDHAFSESSFKRIWRMYVPHVQHQANDGLMLDMQEEQHFYFEKCWV